LSKHLIWHLSEHIYCIGDPDEITADRRDQLLKEQEAGVEVRIYQPRTEHLPGVSYPGVGYNIMAVGKRFICETYEGGVELTGIMEGQAAFKYLPKSGLDSHGLISAWDDYSIVSEDLETFLSRT